MAGIFERIVQGLNLAELVTSYRRSRPENISDRLDEVMAASGEATGFAMAQDCLRALLDLPDEQLPELLEALASRFTIDHKALRQAAKAYQSEAGAETYKALLDCAAPPRRELLRRLNSSPGGTQNLVRLRARLLSVPGYRIDYPEVDIDFIEAFVSWFNRGFLDLRPITWKTPANILEKIISYEAVHEITSWADLRRRMDPRDRRCFGYFHPAMPDEPLIFVQIALTRGMPDAMPPLLDERHDATDGADADTACFYSISNCQIGLRGISFGNFLIKQVAAELKVEFPGIKTFCTLSPMPDFRNWVEKTIGEFDEEDSDFLMRAAAHYICDVKDGDGYPADSVARFHLGNGASAWRLCPDADPSPAGSARSMGMMINYRYDDDQVVKNHERHAETGEIAASPAIHSLQEKFKLPVG